MAVGTHPYPELSELKGVRLAAAPAGIRYAGRLDLALVELDEQAVTGACFTQNAFAAAPVKVAQSHLSQCQPRYLVINSGNANACTGESGIRDALQTCAELAALTQCRPEQVLPFSTGVIGEPLNMDALQAALPGLVDNLHGRQWRGVSDAIMTTDTFPKAVTRTVDLGGNLISITGLAKGSGMICPDMATMLAYVFTDAKISAATVQSLCELAVAKSFNRISVDGDTSTNDACLLCAAQTAKNVEIESLDAPENRAFVEAVIEVFEALAQLLVKDGEGATKFVTVNVTSGATSRDCLAAAYTIAHSPLVKTALFASDPNWGRLVMAVGRAGITGLDANQVRIWADDLLIVNKGSVAADYTEARGQAVFAKSEYELRVDLGMGSCSERVWTCDLSHDYVSINADYRS